MFRAAAILFICLVVARAPQPALFTDSERAKVVAYWNALGRYRVEAPSTPGTNWPWVVRLTPEASLWFYNYNRARGFGKTPPNQIPGADNPQWAAWELWLNTKLAHDRWNAAIAAQSNANGSLVVGAPPPHPGPIPPDLLALAGNPPDFAAAVAPLNYVIRFDTGETITFTDHPDVPQRYAYYRFAHGVRSFGTPLRSIPDSELNAAFTDAGMSAAERKVARAVSLLEGGFESINTYDTGFLSVGFLQFATLERGSGSLGSVLQRMKSSRPVDFEKDFRRFGIDVNDNGELVAVDPNTGGELAGGSAVRKIIDDKRLTAVFQRAGSKSRAFRAAQIWVMKERYYPAYDGITVAAGDKMLSGRVLDVVRSEAGLATLFDRKVNRGNIDPLPSVVAGIVAKYQLASLAEAVAYEREIVAAMRYRHDFLADASLSQPPAQPAPKVITESAPAPAPPSAETSEAETRKPAPAKQPLEMEKPEYTPKPTAPAAPSSTAEPAAKTPAAPSNPALAPKPVPTPESGSAGEPTDNPETPSPSPQ